MGIWGGGSGTTWDKMEAEREDLEGKEGTLAVTRDLGLSQLMG